MLGTGTRRAQNVAALRWWLDAGVDAEVGDTPRDWLRPRAARRAPTLIGPANALATPAATAPPSATAHEASAAACATCAEVFIALEAIAPSPLVWTGPEHSDLLILADPPTAEDHAAGQPVAGDAGRLLDAMLAAIGRSRTTARLGHVYYWPAATTAAVSSTMAFTRRLIALNRPAAILSLGAAPAHHLAATTEALPRLRGRWLEATAKTPLIATLPPAHLLAHPAHKALAWDDLQSLRDQLSQRPRP